MSQAKVDRYKQEKANRKQIMKKEKMQRMAGIVCSWVVLGALAGWALYSGYQYYDSTRPEQTYYCDTTAISDYLSALESEE